MARKPKSTTAMAKLVQQVKSADKATNDILARMVFPLSGPPLRLPYKVKKSNVDSMRWVWSGPDSKSFMPLFGTLGSTGLYTSSAGTTWGSSSGASRATLVLFGQPARPAMVSVLRNRFNGAYTVRFYNTYTGTGSTKAPESFMDLGDSHWTLIPNNTNEWLKSTVGGNVTTTYDNVWPVSSVICDTPTANPLHGFNMPVGEVVGEDVLFVTVGDTVSGVLSFTKLNNTVDHIQTTTGTISGQNVTTLMVTFEIGRVTPEYQLEFMRNVEIPIQLNGSSAAEVSSRTASWSFTFNSVDLPAGFGHIAIQFVNVTVMYAATATTGTEVVPIGYYPSGGLQTTVTFTPATVGCGFALIPNPLIDPYSRGDPELARMCRLTALTMLVSPAALNTPGMGTWSCSTIDNWREGASYEDVVNSQAVGPPTTLPAHTGVFTYLPILRPEWAMAIWGGGLMYELVPQQVQLIELTNTPTTAVTASFALTFETTLECVSTSPRFYNLVSNLPPSALELAEVFILQKAMYFSENPDHLRTFWGLLQEVGSAVWRGAKTLAPYVAPVVATMNPNAAIIMEAFQRLATDTQSYGPSMSVVPP